MLEVKKIKAKVHWTEKYPYLLKEWNLRRNIGITPMSSKLNDRVWWYLSYDDLATGKHFDFEWMSTIARRIAGDGCPFLTGKAVWPGYNDLGSNYKNLSAQWHPEKNGELTPEMVPCQSHKKVWWYLPYDDPETGKHFDFEWQAYIYNRVMGKGCPFLTGNAVWPGFNDLGSNYKNLSAQWHPEKNGELKPERVMPHSRKKVWWYLPYDDPETGKHFDFEWQAYINERVRQNNCPFLTGRAAWPGYNDLASKNRDLSFQWHPTKNGELMPEKVTWFSSKKVWWYLPYDDPETGKHFDFEWQESIDNRVVYGFGCPYLSGQAVWLGFNDLGTRYKMIAKEWHNKRNGKKMPDQIYMYESRLKRWWDCSKCGHEWQATVRSRTVNGGTCPNCRRNKKHYG